MQILFGLYQIKMAESASVLAETFGFDHLVAPRFTLFMRSNFAMQGINFTIFGCENPTYSWVKLFYFFCSIPKEFQLRFSVSELKYWTWWCSLEPRLLMVQSNEDSRIEWRSNGAEWGRTRYEADSRKLRLWIFSWKLLFTEKDPIIAIIAENWASEKR